MRKYIAIFTLISFLTFQVQAVYAWYTIATPSPQLMAATAAVAIGGVTIYLSTESGRATASGYYKKVYYSTVQNGSQLWAVGYALYSTASMIQKTMVDTALTNLKGILNAVTSYLPLGGVTATIPTNTSTQKFAGPTYSPSAADAYSAAQARITWVNAQSNHQSANTPVLSTVTPSAIGLTNGQWTVYYVAYNMVESGSIVSHYDYYVGAVSASQVQQSIDSTAFQTNISAQVASNSALQNEVENVIAQVVAAPPSNLTGPPVYQTYPFDVQNATPVVYTDMPQSLDTNSNPLANWPPFTMPNTTNGSTGTGSTTASTTGTSSNPTVVTTAGTYTGGDASAWIDYHPGTLDMSRFSTRFIAFMTQVQSAPIFSMVRSFFGSVPTGGSSIIEFNAGIYGQHSYDFASWGPLLTVLRGLILIIFSFLAIRVVVLKR